MLSTGSLSDPLLPPHSPQETSNNEASNITPDNDREDTRRKRAYLSLLPPDQIIELCLTFEQHVPLSLRTSIWPPDLDIEILKLKRNASRTEAEPSMSTVPQIAASVDSSRQSAAAQLPLDVPSQQVHPPGLAPPFELPVQPLDVSFPTSLAVIEKSNATESSDCNTDLAQKPTDVVAEASPQPRAAPASAEALVAAEPASSTSTVGADKPAQPSSAVQLTNAETSPSTQADTENVTVSSTATTASATPAASSTPQTAAPLAPYSYAAYGYPPQTGYPSSTTTQAYPHAPYYGASTSTVPGYPAPYSGYSHYPPPPGYAPHAHQPPPPPSSSEDLPSYEDMIVEALTDISDPDGAAPKDLFLWMGSRWPLQTNFRPSASQALQKAYKRGRLEKTDGGRYRLNPNWEGGATSKRTTRRPQTLAQTTYAMHHPPSQNPSTSPFTHAPLPHRSHTSPPPPHPPQHQPYPGYTYPYGGYAGYSGYTPYGAHVAAKPVTAIPAPPAAAKAAVEVKTASKTVPSTTGKEKDGAPLEDSSDAWEAAQHILKAINFGWLQGGPSSSTQSQANAVGTRTSGQPSVTAPPPIMASLGPDVNAPGEDDGLGRVSLTDEERASLQAQLALLAAQLSEIAAEEDEDMSDDDAEVQVPQTPQPQSQPQLQPAQPPEVSKTVVVISADRGRSPPSMIVDVNQFPDDGEGFTLIAPEATSSTDVPMSAPQVQPTGANEEESDEDEDMEMVDVDSYMQSEGIRT